MPGQRALGLLLLAPALLLGGCTGLIFHPLREQVYDPAELGITTQDVWFESTGGLRLHGWFLPAEGPAHGTVLFLHGNAENISTHIASVWWLPKYGYNVFMFDYRGYGRSQGIPTMEGVHADARSALATVFSLPQVDPGRVAVFGQSLGAAVAIDVVAVSPYRERLRALVVEGAPASFRRRARELLGDWWLTWALQWPLSLTVSDRFRPIDAIRAIAPPPLLIVAGGADRVIPPTHAKDLFAAAREPKALWLIPGARHIQAFTKPVQRRRLAAWLDRHMPRAAPSRASGGMR